MSITQSAVEARLADLRAQFKRQEADLNAVGGAIQDCEYWLTVVGTLDSKETGDGGSSDVHGDTGESSGQAVPNGLDGSH
jgi:hypothetical protein